MGDSEYLKKRFFIMQVVILSLCCLFFISCIKDKSKPISDLLEDASPNIKLTIMAPSGELYDIDRKLMTLYEEYSGNKIDFQEIPDDQYANVLKTKLASGKGPDIAIIWAAANSSQFFPDENFVDLSNEQWIGGLSTIALKNQTFNNRVIGFGLEGPSDGWGIIYNKKIFEKHNITVPRNIEEFINVCNRLKKDGIVPFAGSFKEEWTLGVWLANMGPLANIEIPNYYEKLNSNKAHFSESSTFLKFIYDLKNIYDNDFMGKQVFSTTAREAFIKVIKGEAAMALSNGTPGVWVADSRISINIEDYGMFPAPFADNRMLSSYNGGFIRVINKNSNNIELSKDYFNFLSRQENLIKYYTAPERKAITPGFTNFLKVFKRDFLNQDFHNNSNGMQYEIAETSLKYWDNTAYGKYILDAILGKITPEEVLEKIDIDRSKMFKVE